MSSNISIEKQCIQCGKTYTAKTLYTRYCSFPCNRKHYKATKRAEKINGYIESVKEQNKPLNKITQQAIKEKIYLSVNECCVLLGLSRGTILRWIRDGIITSYKYGGKFLIQRSSIDNLFQKHERIAQTKPNRKASQEKTKERRN